jgi:hypothetical protein
MVGLLPCPPFIPHIYFCMIRSPDGRPPWPHLTHDCDCSRETRRRPLPMTRTCFSTLSKCVTMTPKAPHRNGDDAHDSAVGVHFAIISSRRHFGSGVETFIYTTCARARWEVERHRRKRDRFISEPVTPRLRFVSLQPRSPGAGRPAGATTHAHVRHIAFQAKQIN